MSDQLPKDVHLYCKRCDRIAEDHPNEDCAAFATAALLPQKLAELRAYFEGRKTHSYTYGTIETDKALALLAVVEAAQKISDAVDTECELWPWLTDLRRALSNLARNP